MKPIYLQVLVVTISVLVSGCAGTADYSPLIGSEPEVGANLSRAPRTIRLFYDALPDVSRSNLRLLGPAGEHQLRGLHTMAADDLMIEILDPVTTGTYIVEWTTVVGDDPAVYSGSFEFSVTDN